MHYFHRSSVGLALALTLTAGASAAEPSHESNFDRWRALIKPSAQEEKWTQIPWQTSLWEARKQAAIQGKPILLWEMDGNPLGCT